MTEAVLEHGYDGEWFIRAYDANGNKVGSNECDEGKIFIESNGFCVMAGIGKEDGKAQKHLTALKNILNVNMALYSIIRHIRDIDLNLVKSRHIRRDIKKMQECSVIITHG